jgi:predicted nucleic acid-binding protein
LPEWQITCRNESVEFHGAADIRIRLQVHAELLVDAAKSANPSQAKARLLAYLAPFAITWHDSAIEDSYLAIRAQLEVLGTPISEADLWIAATAQANGGTLITNNTAEFRGFQKTSFAVF